MTGPLHGVRVLEFAGLGPAPFAAMLLADMGADVIRLERPEPGPLQSIATPVVTRGRPTLTSDLKTEEGLELAGQLIDRADALIEGFRPGVMERLGLGPDVALQRNPRLVYGRMTGYGQDGPYAQRPGHDINYIAVAGVLGAIARRGERPLAPLNLIGDYGGGGMLLAFGVLCALLEARASGAGQVVDAAMVDGAALLSALIHGLRASGLWSDTPGTNLLDSGAHFYEVYETADGGFVAVGALEPQFYAALLALLEVDPQTAPQFQRDRWPALKERFTEIFAARTTSEWSELIDQAPDACTTIVPALADAPKHKHNRSRGTFIEHDGVVQPAPAPRLSRTPAAIHPLEPDAAERALTRWGVRPGQVF